MSDAADTENRSNSATRIDLPWGGTALRSAALWLVETYRVRDRLNMKDFIVAVPTARSRRRLLQMMVEEAQTLSLLFTPPTLTNIGQLPEFLYRQEKPLASELTRRMAWVQSLKRTDDEAVFEIFPRLRTGEIADYMAAATMLQTLHSRLAADILSFRSVKEKISSMSEFPETDRWETLAQVQSHYYEILKEVGLWDQQAARSFAAKGDGCSTDKQIILVGVADLNRATRTMLEQIGSSVTSVVFCDPEHCDRFDDFGGLITQQWLDEPIDIDDERLLIVDGPTDQGYAVANYLTNLESEVHADQITIGAPNPEIVPQIERSLSSIGLESRNLSGLKFHESASIRLLVTIREYLRRGDFASYAEMVRHPDMYDWINRTTELNGDWLVLLDEFQQKRLPGLIDLDEEIQFPSVVVFNEPRPDHLQTVYRAVRELLLPVGPSHGKQPLKEWADPWIEIIMKLFGERELDRHNLHDRLLFKSCDAINQAFSDHQKMPADWEFKLSAHEALDLAIQATGLQTLTDEPSHEAVEIAGWLDLRLDDAEVVVVTSFNDEFVPSVENADLFLPNSLCKSLGIVDNDRRYARDAYSLGMINAARDNLLLICGRKRVNGDPLVPSRLMMATDGGKVALRAKAFFSHPGSDSNRFWLANRGDVHDVQQFGIPNPADFDQVKEINKISVTKFKQFLECPYRFYLNRILKLTAAGDNAREMDGGSFGDLAHEVLSDFASDEGIKDSQRANEIADYLCGRLDERVEKLFSTSRLPAVAVQIEQLRLRLKLFADLQAEQRSAGWRIAYAEEYCLHELEVDGRPFTISGIIDRVDQHEGTGDVFVWDYKTSDRGDEPEQTHYYQRSGWVDLQLPLYRHLVTELEFENQSGRPVGLGYITLPRDLKKIKFAPANWPEQMLAEADEKAFEVIRALREQVFYPPNPRPPKFSEDFAGICREEVLEEAPLAEEGVEL